MRLLFQQKKGFCDWLLPWGKARTTWRNVVVCCLMTIYGLTFSVSPSYGFTIKEEKELGDKLIYSVRAAFPIVDDPDIYQYINNLGHDVLAVAGVQFFNYHFYVIDSTEFNAFAAPSGFVFFYSGLISAMNSEDELLAVLAHEIGHVVKRHLAARMERSTVSTAATTTLALAGLLFGGPLAPALMTAALAAGQSMSLSYSRRNEEEADLLAYDWMKALHRNPEGQVKMLSTMRRVARYRSSKLPQYLLTHPNPEARLDYVESLIIIDENRNDRIIEDVDNFEFFRFKYRVLSQVNDIRAFRDLLVSQFTSQRSSEFQKKMAEYGLALVAIKQNDTERGLQYLNNVIANFPDKLILIGDRGYAQLEAGNLEAAERDLRYVLKRDRNDMFATFNLGRVMAQKGDIDEAEKQYKTVLYDIPEYSKAYFELGRISNARGELGVAAFYLGKYNLYLGKLKIAVFNFKYAVESEQIPDKMKEESEGYLKTIEELMEQ